MTANRMTLAIDGPARGARDVAHPHRRAAAARRHRRHPRRRAVQPGRAARRAERGDRERGRARHHRRPVRAARPAADRRPRRGSDELDSNLTWTISNAEDAAEGLADGTYAAVVTIPENFSAAATSTARGHAEQRHDRGPTPPDSLIVDDAITAQVTRPRHPSWARSFEGVPRERVPRLHDARRPARSRRPTARAQLADGAQQAADGAAQLPGGVTQLADGARGIATERRARGRAGADRGRDRATPRRVRTSSAAGRRRGGRRLVQAGARAGEITATGGRGARRTGSCATRRGGAGLSATLAKPCVLHVRGLRRQRILRPACSAATVRPMPRPAPGSSRAGHASRPSTGIGSRHAARRDQRPARTMATSVARARARPRRSSPAASTSPPTAPGALERRDAAPRRRATQLATGAQCLADGVRSARDRHRRARDRPADRRRLGPDLHRPRGDRASRTSSRTRSRRTASGTSLFGASAIPLLATLALWFGGLAHVRGAAGRVPSRAPSRAPSALLALRALRAGRGARRGRRDSSSPARPARGILRLGRWSLFAGVCIAAGIAFAAVNQALVAVFSGAGAGSRR